MQSIEDKKSKAIKFKTPARLREKREKTTLDLIARRVKLESFKLNGSISNEWLNSRTTWSVVDKQIIFNIDLSRLNLLERTFVKNSLTKNKSINSTNRMFAGQHEKALNRSSEIGPEQRDKLLTKALVKHSPIKHELKFIYLFNIALLACMLSMNGSGVQACDVWKASDCMGSITTAEEEIMKSDDYTKEELFKYCDKGKAYVDCVNNKLKCCDLKPELRGSLAAYDKQLEKQAWKLGPFCAGLGESNVIKYKCRTTTKATTTTATKSSKSTMAPCQVEKVSFLFFFCFVNK
jgi:hypothetical protein